MPKKQNLISIAINFSKDPNQEGCYGDKVAFFPPSTTTERVSAFISVSLMPGEQVGYLRLYGEWSKAFSLVSLVAIIRESFDPYGYYIEIENSRLTAEDLVTLCKNFDSVSLTHCYLGRGWWLPSSQDNPCTRLAFHNCSFAKPPPVRVGSSGWPKLSDVTFCDIDWTKGRFPSGFAAAFYWGPWLESFSLYGSQDLEFLKSLPPLESLRMLGLDWSKTDTPLFEWVLLHRKLQSLSIGWEGACELPLASLKQLKSLRSLDLSSSHCSDDELLTVLSNTSLRIIDLTQSALPTAKSWKTILSNKTLRSVWVNHHIFEGSMPEDLPEKTGLRFLDGINVGPLRHRHIAYLHQKYPNVKFDVDDHTSLDVWAQDSAALCID